MWIFAMAGRTLWLVRQKFGCKRFLFVVKSPSMWASSGDTFTYFFIQRFIDIYLGLIYSRIPLLKFLYRMTRHWRAGCLRRPILEKAWEKTFRPKEMKRTRKTTRTTMSDMWGQHVACVVFQLYFTISVSRRRRNGDNRDAGRSSGGYECRLKWND